MIIKHSELRNTSRVSVFEVIKNSDVRSLFFCWPVFIHSLSKWGPDRLFVL